MTIARDSSSSMARSHGVTKAKTSNSFVEALNKKRRCRGRRTTIASTQVPPVPRRALGLSYEAAARLRPKLWTSGGTNPPTQEQPPRLKIIRKRSHGKISGRQVRAPEEDPAACGSAISEKKPRCVSSQTSRQSIQPRSPSFLTSDLLRRRYGGGGIVRRRHNEKRAVAFADPIVSEVRTRPRTPRNCIADLFYCRADEARFRREEQQRRKILRQTCEPSSCEHEHEEDPNEVTESDDNSSSSDED